MTAARRRRLKSSTFGLPGQRKYPLDTKGRARNALSRVSQHGTPAQKARVRSAVSRKYPSIKVGGKKRTRSRTSSRRKTGARRRRRR